MRGTAALLAAVLVLSACGPADEGGREVASGATPSVSPTPAPAPAPSAGGGCPERYLATGDEPWVPASPTTETPGRLVPDADPVEALVCRYGDVFDAESSALAGEVVLEGGLDRIRTDLLVPERDEAVERACTQIGGGFVPHLVRLRYADGDLWLSAVAEPNRCSPSGNGVFVSSAPLGDLLARAYDSGTWPARDPDPCAPPRPGRAGQAQALVPDGWTALTVCADDGPRRDVALDRARQVVDLLRQVETRPGTNGCEGTPASVSRLVAAYPAGPAVTVVWTPGCEPSLGNGSLSAMPTPAQAELLGVLLG